MKAVPGAGLAALLRELWAWNAAYLCSVSPGASLVISETETEGLDKETWGTAGVVGLPARGAALPPAGRQDISGALTRELEVWP